MKNTNITILLSLEIMVICTYLILNNQKTQNFKKINCNNLKTGITFLNNSVRISTFFWF